MRIVAPAKLNLFLHITGKRADGYHLLESLAVFTTFGDALEIAPSEKLSLDVTGPFALGLEGSEHNLVLRAARALQQHGNVTQGARITLHKHIPIGAGLGGGSSDAATILLGLVKFWNLSVTQLQLHGLGATLGSDVPVCLLQKPSWVAGVGEQVTPVTLSFDGSVVMVNPRTPLLTAEVYRRFGGEFSKPAAKPPIMRTTDALLKYIRPLGNALEAPAMAIQPQIGDILAALKASEGCALARMSGSGATCYGIFEDVQQARQAAHTLRRAHPTWWVQESDLRKEG